MSFDLDSIDWKQWAFHPLIASLCGAALTLWNGIPGSSRGVRLTNAISTFIVGVFVGAAIVEWRGMTSRSLIGLTHLLTAIGGLILMSGFLSYLQETKFADLPIIRGFLKGPQPPVAAAPPKEGP